jgi:hypothetical protein
VRLARFLAAGGLKGGCFVGFKDRLKRSAGMGTPGRLGDMVSSAGATKRSSRLEIEVDDSGYRAGDTVKGTVRVTEAFEVMKIEASLRFRCASPDHVGGILRAGPVLLHQGPVSGGETWPFELVLPADAEPEFEIHLKKSLTFSNRPQLLSFDWTASVDHTGAEGKTRARFGPLGPVTGGRAEFDSSPGQTARSDELDVVVTPSAAGVRPGERIGASFDVGSADGGLEAGLVCEVNYQEDTDDGQGGYSVANKTFDWLADWRPLEGSTTHEFEVPPDAPTSVDRAEAGVTWEIRAREQKRMRKDPTTAAPLLVRP